MHEGWLKPYYVAMSLKQLSLKMVKCVLIFHLKKVLLLVSRGNLCHVIETIEDLVALMLGATDVYVAKLLGKQVF